MEREWLLCVLLVTLGGMALQSVSWLPSNHTHDTCGDAFEREAWFSLWWPLLPALLVAAWLGGWAATQRDPVRDPLGIWTLYGIWAPFAFVLARALVRALWALLSPVPERGVSTVGLLHPRTLFSPFLARQLDDAAIRAALAHEQAHARHRDPLRIWLAQFITDLQWPWPSAQRRFETWLVALELARDDEARQQGTDGADLAAAIMASIRFVRATSITDTPSHAGSRVADACLVGDSRVLEERVSRLLQPLPENVRGSGHAVLSFEVAALLLVPLLLLAACAGVLYGAPLLRALLALTS